MPTQKSSEGLTQCGAGAATPWQGVARRCKAPKARAWSHQTLSRAAHQVQNWDRGPGRGAAAKHTQHSTAPYPVVQQRGCVRLTLYVIECGGEAHAPQSPRLAPNSHCLGVLLRASSLGLTLAKHQGSSFTVGCGPLRDDYLPTLHVSSPFSHTLHVAACFSLSVVVKVDR